MNHSIEENEMLLFIFFDDLEKIVIDFFLDRLDSRLNFFGIKCKKRKKNGKNEKNWQKKKKKMAKKDIKLKTKKLKLYLVVFEY